MKTYTSLEKPNHFRKPGVIAIGFFDGFHLGHQKILSELLKIAAKKNKNHFVLTYTLLEKKGAPLLSLNKKLKLFKDFGVKNVILIDRDEKFLNYSPADFLQLLKNNFRIDEFVIGHDFAFGKNRKGDLKTLKTHGFAVNQVKPVLYKKRIVSTTLIKQLIKNGDMEIVGKLIKSENKTIKVRKVSPETLKLAKR
jgi:riboflavin kinase / FMN adenylyltransferase